MYILDKNKDFYDYLSHTYGVDKAITFDRRGSKVLTQEELRDQVVNDSYCGIHSGTSRFFILEIGNLQFLFQIEKITLIQKENWVKGIRPIWDGSWSLIKTYAEGKHHFKREITIVPCMVRYEINWKKHNKDVQIGPSFKESVTSLRIDQAIELPIISNTVLPGFLDTFTIWSELSNFISAKKNDKDVDLKMTDVERAVNHGFDKKTSFRNPIKL